MPSYTWEPPLVGDQPTTVRRENDDGSISFIPNDPANKDYQEFLAYEEAQKQASQEPTQRR